MTDEEILAHIEILKSIIANYQTAILQLSTGTVRQHSLNTGQTTISVTKRNLSTMRKDLLGFISDLGTYRGMLSTTTNDDYVRSL